MHALSLLYANDIPGVVLISTNENNLFRTSN